MWVLHFITFISRIFFYGKFVDFVCDFSSYGIWLSEVQTVPSALFMDVVWNPLAYTGTLHSRQAAHASITNKVIFFVTSRNVLSFFVTLLLSGSIVDFIWPSFLPLRYTSDVVFGPFREKFRTFFFSNVSSDSFILFVFPHARFFFLFLDIFFNSFRRQESSTFLYPKSRKKCTKPENMKIYYIYSRKPLGINTSGDEKKKKKR